MMHDTELYGSQTDACLAHAHKQCTDAMHNNVTTVVQCVYMMALVISSALKCKGLQHSMKAKANYC